MPMNFPDFDSLKRCAKVHKFREPYLNESEEIYRTALADHVKNIDFIESCEIRNKVGWDQFTDAQNLSMLLERVFSNK